jgi:ribonuclease HII
VKAILHNTIAGVDEAGRGSAIGPMVIAGVLLEEDFLEAVKSQGVKDSKRLPPEKREKLYEFIVDGAVRVAFTVLNPNIIDRYVKFKKTLGGLNALELKEITCIVRELRATKIYVDCPDVNLTRFCRVLKSEVPWNAEVIALHGKYDDHPAVASASIVAKVLRDRIVRSLRDLYGDFGSGYPSDLKTISFLKENYGSKLSERLIRKSWKVSKLNHKSNSV